MENLLKASIPAIDALSMSANESRHQSSHLVQCIYQIGSIAEMIYSFANSNPQRWERRYIVKKGQISQTQAAHISVLWNREMTTVYLQGAVTIIKEGRYVWTPLYIGLSM
jgi:hypothetical protein